MPKLLHSRAHELLSRAIRNCPEGSCARLAIIGTGLALVELRHDIQGMRRDIVKLMRAHQIPRSHPPAPMFGYPPGTDEKLCRTCGELIVWATTKHGKRIPMDPEPAPRGRFVLVDGVAETGPGEPRYDSHFETCPDADYHSGRGRS